MFEGVPSLTLLVPGVTSVVTFVLHGCDPPHLYHNVESMLGLYVFSVLLVHKTCDDIRRALPVPVGLFRCFTRGNAEPFQKPSHTSSITNKLFLLIQK